MSIRTRLSALYTSSSDTGLIVLAFLVGLWTGGVAWVFIRAVEWVQFWPAVPGRSHLFHWTLSRWDLVAIPTLGGLLCGLVVQYGTPHAAGTGTVDLMYSLRRKEGRIPWRDTIGKAVAAFFTVCSGAAAGPEGPVVFVGAGMGSWLGERLNLDSSQLRSLVVAGAAAGFAAVFNAPIAGVLFATEVLLKEFTPQAFGIIVLSTVTASVSTHWLLGNEVFVHVPPDYSFNHPVELLFYAGLAIAAAILAKLFIRIYFYIHDLFEKSTLPPSVKTMIGGLIVGLMGWLIPAVLGNGHLEIPSLITCESSLPWTAGTMLVLLVGKMVVCPVTVTSGGSGGIFIPYLLMGSLLSGLVGRGVHLLYPAAAPTGAYMLVGMAAVFSGITNAPFTAIILLFELTRDYNVILPLLFTVGITQMVARMIHSESLDGLKLFSKGVRLHDAIELRALENYHVGPLMTTSVATLPATMPLSDLTAFFSHHVHTGYPVVNERNQPIGLLTVVELYAALKKDRASDVLTAKDIMRSDFPSVAPEDSLTEAVRRMHLKKADRIIVIDPSTHHMVGLLTQTDILSIYRELLR